MSGTDLKLQPGLLGRSLLTNIFSGGLWRVWQAALQFALTPVYIHLLGPAAYGLVGFNATLILLLGFLDQAVSPVLMREFGRLSGQPNGAAEMRAVLFRLQAVSLAMAFVVGAGIIAAAPLIVSHGIDAGGIPRPEIITAVRLIGLTIAGQWPAFLFGAGFIGLQRQDVLARLRVILMTVQAVGAALALMWIAPTTTVFFGWQAGISIPFSAIYGYFLWRKMPARQAGPSGAAIRLGPILRFGAGTLSIGLLAALLAQADNLVVAKYVPLHLFASYSLSFTLVTQVFALVLAPVASALLPHFTRVTARNDRTQLAHEYHRWSQLIALVTLPLAGVLIVFGRPILELWLGAGSPVIGPMVEILPYVALGSLLSGFAAPCSLMQLAAGWTRLTVATNIVTIGLFIPALLLTIPRHGMVAGAVCWLLVNLGTLGVQVPLALRRLLPGIFWRWLGRDVLLPGLISFLVFFAAWTLGATRQGAFAGTACAGGTAMLAAVAMLAALPHGRQEAMRLMGRMSERWARRG